MKYTIRDIPPSLDAELRERARREGKRLSQMALEAMERGVRLQPTSAPQRSLEDVVGTWRDDAALEHALQDQRTA